MKAKNGLRRMLPIAVMICVIMMVGMTVFAENDSSGNKAVKAAKQGVLLIQVGVQLEDNSILTIKTGTGFLVNANNIVTAYHIVNFNDNEYDFLRECLGLDKKKAKDRKVITVGAYRDLTVPGKIVIGSQTSDLSILEIDQPMQNRTLLINEGDLGQKTPCYSLGYPISMDDIDDAPITYISDDVVIKEGMINKVTPIARGIRGIIHSAQIPPSGSGGPLVSFSGSVIGINQRIASGDGLEDYSYAIGVRELIEMMDSFGIEYTIETPEDVTNPTLITLPAIIAIVAVVVLLIIVIALC